MIQPETFRVLGKTANIKKEFLHTFHRWAGCDK